MAVQTRESGPRCVFLALIFMDKGKEQDASTDACHFIVMHNPAGSFGFVIGYFLAWRSSIIVGLSVSRPTRKQPWDSPIRTIDSRRSNWDATTTGPFKGAYVVALTWSTVSQLTSVFISYIGHSKS